MINRKIFAKLTPFAGPLPHHNSALPLPDISLSSSSLLRISRLLRHDSHLTAFITPLLQEPSGSVSTLPKLHLGSKASNFFSIREPIVENLIIYHRVCYQLIFKKLQQWDDHEFQRLKQSVFSQCGLTGTPGIGKSHSFFSFLRLYLLERNQDGSFSRRMVGYERKYEEKIILFELNEEGTGILAYSLMNFKPYEDALSAVLKPTDVIFRDFEQHKVESIQFLGLNAREILLASIRRRGFGDYLKYVPESAQLVIPPLTEAEIVELGRLMGYPIEGIRDAQALFSVFGGVPRYCYEQATEQQRWHDFVHLFLDRRLSSILELNTRSTSLNSIKMISDDSFSHRKLAFSCAG